MTSQWWYELLRRTRFTGTGFDSSSVPLSISHSTRLADCLVCRSFGIAVVFDIIRQRRAGCFLVGVRVWLVSLLVVDTLIRRTVLRRRRGVGLLRVRAALEVVAYFTGVALQLSSLLEDETDWRTTRDGVRFLHERRRRGEVCRRTWPSSNPIY